MNKPFAESSEQNREPILAVLRQVFERAGELLEIGSGTGQHAYYFSAALPHLRWQCSDVAENQEGIRAWLSEAVTPQPEPLILDVSMQSWPIDRADYIFSANTVHIMAWPQVEQMFAGIGEIIAEGGRFALYGPFNYNGGYTSDSNARFDEWLKGRDPESGIRDFEALDRLANAAGLNLLQDFAMPANNRTLVWQRNGAT